MKNTVEKSQTIATGVARCIFSIRQFEDTCDNMLEGSPYKCNQAFSHAGNLSDIFKTQFPKTVQYNLPQNMDVYQYICGTGLFALVFLHHTVLSVPIDCQLGSKLALRTLVSVFKCVSSNSIPVRMQSHIGCICFTFLHCASLNLS